MRRADETAKLYNILFDSATFYNSQIRMSTIFT